MHAATYRVCPEAAFVVHTHADACTALACLGSELPAFHYMVVQFGGANVRCAPYVTFGTAVLADLVAEAIRGRSACLLANHGMIVCAATAVQTLSRALLLETLCRQYLLALAAGTPRLLTEQEMLGAQERFKTYGRLALRHSPHCHSRHSRTHRRLHSDRIAGNHGENAVAGSIRPDKTTRIDPCPSP